MVGVKDLTESGIFIHVTSLFWKVNHDQKTIELKFELPIHYENPDIGMITEITESIFPVLMNNGFIVQDGGWNCTNEELIVPCTYSDESQIEKSLLDIKDELEHNNWYVDIIPTIIYENSNVQ